ncbi:hypothetical protein GIB67_014814 [Kingdonia uniflora]|uniref:Uncharacterized protein n=1 Tax=Kingdonia uniflora TaxID=39325 RepID=A0A7J7LC59_9MAGN|nr:hypothetical protein GIB67_014814 [Kingdonia uniflora]
MFPCFRRQRSNAIGEDEEEDDLVLDPVLLVSGMGGSILNAKNKRTGFEIRVWVRILLANLEFQKKAFSLYNPKTGLPSSSIIICLTVVPLCIPSAGGTEVGSYVVVLTLRVGLVLAQNLPSFPGYTESLDKNIDVIVPSGDHGLYAIDILDPSVWVKCAHVTEVYQFHDMIDMLLGSGYKKGITLFGYGYDFWQSNRIDKTMDGLKIKLDTAFKASGGRKVNIISHSMGGLLVSCLLSLHQDV